jgi:hypothetical protein
MFDLTPPCASSEMVHFRKRTGEKEFEKTMSNYTIGNVPKNKPKMSSSEVICIMIIFHGMNQKTMKNFYLNFVQKYLKDLLPQTVSYNRFVELMQ